MGIQYEHSQNAQRVKPNIITSQMFKDTSPEHLKFKSMY